MDKLISIIIPVYNPGEFFDRCIESVINQTYRNLEIILVDDGSTDSSPHKCDELAKKDSRIKVIHQKNSGAAAARNTGLDNATGDFIGFIDADDYIDLDMYEIMLNDIISNDADAARCGIVRESTDGSTQDWGTGIFDMRICDGKHVLCDVGEAVGIVPVHLGNKLFKRECVNNIRMNTRFRFAEDTLFNFMVAKNVNKMVYRDVNRYHYMDNADSITNNDINENNFDEHRVMDVIFSLSDEETLPHCIKGDVLKSFRTLRQMILADKYMDRFDFMRNRIISHKKEILSQPIYSKLTRLRTLLLSASPKGYIFAIKHLRGKI